MTKPVFGELFTGIWASPSNPHRCGMYVRTVVRRGRMNPGTWYELTDGKGKFWQYKASEVLPGRATEDACAGARVMSSERSS